MNLPSGWYYYHPGEHRLGRIEAREMPDLDLYGPNQSLQHNSAFSLFLIANMDAIEPIYGDRARDFCLIETGYIGQLLMEQAPDFNLGLCPIGGFDPAALHSLLGLSAQYQPLHALLGGAIDPSWNQQWRAIEPARADTSSSNTLSSNTLSSIAVTGNTIADTLRQYLSEKLPRYMVPNRYHLLESLPLTANGKVDRRSLPTPTLGSTAVYVAPKNPTEKTIVQLWQTLLKLEQVGLDDNFFEVGGNSLTAMQLLSQLQNTFQIELTIAQLFEALTPAQQGQLVDASPKISEPAIAGDTSDSRAPSQLSTIPRRQTKAPLEGISELSDETVDDLLQQLIAPDNQEASS
jgi:acyl carrier protein